MDPIDSGPSDDLFPSGPWTGFYTYTPARRERMELHLTFANGSVRGDGTDPVGEFTIRGRYDCASLECVWTKAYRGRHDVQYRGFREGKGIWGVWELGPGQRGGFSIWPRRLGEAAGAETSASASAPIEPVRRLVPSTADAPAPAPAGAPESGRAGGIIPCPAFRDSRVRSCRQARI